MKVNHSEVPQLLSAPNGPGHTPNWCSAQKQVVLTSAGPSRVWATIGQGILNEIYFPRIDIPQIRDLGFIIADGSGFWIELKTIKECQIEYAEPGICAISITHQHPRFTFIQRIIPEPDRDVMLVETRLVSEEDLQVFALVAPHLGGTGVNNYGSVKRAGNRTVLSAKQGPFALAMAVVDATTQADTMSLPSVGYSGTSDLWQQFHQNADIQACYQHAGPGNIALSARIAPFSILALGFANGEEAASTLAVSALLQPFNGVWQKHIEQWRAWQSHTFCPSSTAAGESLDQSLCDQLQISAMVLKIHFDQTFRGAMVASLSVPWGDYADERPGYHLVWPRDLTECAGAFLAIGAEVEARDILRYLMATQKNDGSWHQNQWLGGTPFWTGLQLDQVAFPVLLAGMLADRNALDGIEVSSMVASAIAFILQHGPVSPQDRWEESSGTNPFTLSVVIAALVSGARFLNGDQKEWALRFADYWNFRIEDWTAVTESRFIKAADVNAHYVKVVPGYALEDRAAMQLPNAIKNRQENFNLPAADQIACDFLQLVRFGLRLPDDPVVLNTVKLVDETLKVELPQGPCWYRYTLDGYGEHENGAPYDGTGIGRPWPLLTGERGHYELCRSGSAVEFAQTMTAMAGEGGMLPEQLWDNPATTTHSMAFAGPTGSAMPLAWAHAEYIKLIFSLVEGAPVDRPKPVWARYQGRKPTVDFWLWSPVAPFAALPAGIDLFLCCHTAATIAVVTDAGRALKLDKTIMTLGLHIYLISEKFQPGDRLVVAYGFEGSQTTYSIDILDPYFG